MLVDNLGSRGKVLGFAEPYHAFVKDLLEKTSDPWTDVLLFALDRWLLRPKIEEWLSGGVTLVASRSIYCSVAYQGAQGVSWEDVLGANNWESLILPDIYIMLDADPDLAYGRSSGAEKFEDLEFLKKVRKQYLDIYRERDRFPTRMVLVDATPSLQEVFDEVMGIVERAEEA